ncbi:MAG TPA: hypothetical protein VHJ17_11725, partial [Thermomonospora sp.]|nr:hypothetical protein [Thermomonospora sp.]
APRASWASRRPVELVAAGLAGALIGGGLVGALDVLDDDGDDDRVVRVIERGGGPGPGWRRWDREFGEDLPERIPPEWRRPRRILPPEAPTEAPTEVPTPSPSPTG